MAIDLFRVSHGIEIENDALNRADILVGDSLPGGDAGVEDSAPIGTLYLRTNAEADGLQVYWKFTTVNNSAADWKQGADKDYVDAIAAGLSWREPALVKDATTYADITAAETAANVADTVDGVGIAVDDRVLITDLTSGNENVYIVSGSTGAWTFTEDTNLATDGDALLIQEGTSAETQWVFDGTSWVQFGGATGAAELGYLRTFVGKSGPGSELPTYSSTDVIAQSSDLETAIGALDNAMGDGEITNDGGNFALSDDMSYGVAGTLEVSDALDELNEAVGDRTYTNDNVVTDGETVASSIDALDTAVGDLQVQELVISGVQPATVLTTMDTIAVADATEVKWIIQVRATGTPANRRALEIHAMTDGTAVDFTSYAVLKLGAAIPGINFAVSISGTDMILTVNSTPGVDYVVKRVAYSTF